MTKIDSIKQYIESNFGVELNAIHIDDISRIVYQKHEEMSKDIFSKIVECVCESYGINIVRKAANGKLTRFGKAPEGRYIIFSFLRDVSRMTLKEIGLKFGLDHATVLNGLKKVEQWSQTDRFFVQHKEELFEQMKVIILKSKQND